MTKFYVDDQGRYIGGFDGAEPTEGAIEIQAPPRNASEVWYGGQWQAVVVAPDRVPMLNAHLVLIDAGWMDDIVAYLDAIPGPDGAKARAYFAQALTMERTHPLVLGIPAALGKTEAQVDALFIAADDLHV